MSTLATTPGARRVLAASIVARLPIPMLGIALLVHAQQLSGSYAVAGLVTAAYAVATGAGGPALGRLADRRGQTAVLLGGAATAAALLGAMAALPASAARPPLLVALAAGVGLATPPAGACVRALLPGLVADREALRLVYAIDATAVELTWVAGPPLALAFGVVWSTGVAVGLAGAILLGGTAAFAVQPASRRWRPVDGAAGGRPRGGALRSAGMQTLVVVLVAAGALFGAVEVAVTASAGALGKGAAAGPLLGVWGLGSLLGGVLATRLGGGARDAAGLARLLAALAAGHLALTLAAGSLVALGGVLLVAGAAIAPTYAAVYAMVDRVAPQGTATEAFAWLATAAAVGSAAGNAVAGALADGRGATAAFVLAAGAGAVAALVAALRAHTLDSPADGPVVVAPRPAVA